MALAIIVVLAEVKVAIVAVVVVVSRLILLIIVSHMSLHQAQPLCIQGEVFSLEEV